MDVLHDLANSASHTSFNRLLRLQGQATNGCWMDFFECVIVIVIVIGNF